MLVLVEGEKPQEKPWEPLDNQQQIQPTYGTELESNPGHTDWRRAPSSDFRSVIILYHLHQSKTGAKPFGFHVSLAPQTK